MTEPPRKAPVEAEADRPRTAAAVAEALDLLSSHPRHTDRRAWLFMLAMFVPTIAIGGLLLASVVRSFDPGEAIAWRDRAIMSLRTLLAVAAFFAAFGATGLLSLRLARLRSLSEDAPASGRLLLLLLIGVVLAAVVPTIVLDLASNPWLRLAAHLAAPLALMTLLAAIEIGEREEGGETPSHFAAFLRWIEVLSLTFGVVMLSNIVSRFLRIPDAETWPFLKWAIPPDLTEAWRSVIAKLLVLEAAIILAGLVWMFRHWWVNRREENFEQDPDWPDRLLDRVASLNGSDGQPLFDEPLKWPSSPRPSASRPTSPPDRFDCLFPSGQATSYQSRAIESLHRDYADALSRADGRTDIETGLESANALLLGEPGGGIEETMAAAAVVARLRGHRVLLVAPNEHRLDLLASRIRVALATLAMDAAVDLVKLSSRELHERLRAPAEAARKPLPSIMLATRRSFDAFITSHAIGNREPEFESDQLNAAAEFIAECETVLVDRLEMFAAEDRFAIPFILSLLRTLIRTRGGIEQFVVGIGLEAASNEPVSGSSGRHELADSELGTSIDAAVTVLWERLFGESQSRTPRVCHLRRQSLPSLIPLEIVVPDEAVPRVQETIETYLKEQRVRAAVWPDDHGHGRGATALKRWVPLRSIRDIPRFDARTRECLLIRAFEFAEDDPLDEGQRQDRERQVAERHHELSALKGWFGGGRARDQPLRFIRVLADSARQPKDRGRVSPPAQLVLPERDDALRGLPYLVSAALLMTPEIPVRRPLLTDLGVPDQETPNRGGADGRTLPLLRADPPREDLDGVRIAGADVLPILWRDERCAGRDALVGWLPGRSPESRSVPSLCIEQSGIILAPSWADSSSDDPSSTANTGARYARWSFDSGDRLHVDLVVANEFEYRSDRVGYWPKRFRMKDGAVQLEAALWRNDGRETHLPILSLRRFEIETPKDKWSPPSANLRVWGDLFGRCQIRFHGGAGIDIDGRGGRTTPLDPPAEITYGARASIVAPVLESGPSSEVIERLRVSLPRIFSTDESVEGCRFLARETRRLAAALAVNCVGILDCSRVLAFAFDAGGQPRTLLLVITPLECGSTVHKMLADALSHERFVDSIARLSDDDRLIRIPSQPRQPRWESVDAPSDNAERVPSLL